MTLTGIERKQIEEAQAKLERRRYEWDHFSDGTPVAAYAEFESEPRPDRYTAPLGE